LLSVNSAWLASRAIVLFVRRPASLVPLASHEAAYENIGLTAQPRAPEAPGPPGKLSARRAHWTSCSE
jgi:hypothetical protein